MADNLRGTVFMRVHWLYGAMGLLFITAALVFLWAFIFRTPHQLDNLIVIFPFCVMFPIGVFQWLLATRHRVAYDREEVEVSSPLGIKVSFNWANVVRLSVNKWLAIYYITLSNGRRVMINGQMAGLNTFKKVFKEKTGIAFPEEE